MLILDTSFRERTPAETFEYVHQYCHRFGITRLTDITRLDRVGVPVYSAVRPEARPGSLSVSSGKGLNREDARLGALCEAIELSCAEFDPSRHLIFRRPLGDLERCGYDAYDLGVATPYIKKLSGRQEIDCVRVESLLNGHEAFMPASVIFLPYGQDTPVFRESSNGLAGGNTLHEAQLHGLLEVIERDVLSFTYVCQCENTITDIATPTFDELRAQIEAAELRLHVTSVVNQYGLPLFVAYLFESKDELGVLVSRGQGLHLRKDIALHRAVTEAIQSRLTHIQGARDDIIGRHLHYQSLGHATELRDVTRLSTKLNALPKLSYSQITSKAPELKGTDEYLNWLLRHLYSIGFCEPYFFNLTVYKDAFHIVKVVAPGMEFLSPKTMYLGRRLLACLAEIE